MVTTTPAECRAVDTTSSHTRRARSEKDDKTKKEEEKDKRCATTRLSPSANATFDMMHIRTSSLCRRRSARRNATLPSMYLGVGRRTRTHQTMYLNRLLQVRVIRRASYGRAGEERNVKKK